LAFVGLGLVNTRRNLGRSSMAVASMAVAALVVTSLLSLSASSHQGAMLPQRFLLGGDVIITPLKLASGAQDLDPAGSAPGSWHLGRVPYDASGIWGEIVPWIWQYGMLGPEVGVTAPDGGAGGQATGPWMSPEQVDAVLTRLSSMPRVRAAVPVTMLPMLEQAESSPAGPGGPGPTYGFLLGRNAAADRETFGRYFGELMAQGSYLEAGEGGLFGAVVDMMRGQRGYAAFYPGNLLSVLVPAASAAPGGAPVFDCSDLEPLDLTVSGLLRTQTDVQMSDDQAVSAYWGTGAVLVSEETIAQIARQRGLDRPPVTAVAVRAGNLIDLKGLVGELRAEFPGLTVLAVSELVAATMGTGAASPLMSEADVSLTSRNLVPRAIPLDLNLLFSVIAFTVAALMVASNLLVLLTARRREIGILRALGATALDVGVMVMTEALTLTVAGCILGYWPIRLLSTITLFSNRLSLVRAAALTLTGFGAVLGLGLALAAVFALLPALATTRLTCTEALRND
jgi:hypothetical protein